MNTIGSRIKFGDLLPGFAFDSFAPTALNQNGATRHVRIGSASDRAHPDIRRCLGLPGWDIDEQSL